MYKEFAKAHPRLGKGTLKTGLQWFSQILTRFVHTPRTHQHGPLVRVACSLLGVGWLLLRRMEMKQKDPQPLGRQRQPKRKKPSTATKAATKGASAGASSDAGAGAGAGASTDAAEVRTDWGVGGDFAASDAKKQKTTHEGEDGSGVDSKSGGTKATKKAKKDKKVKKDKKAKKDKKSKKEKAASTS